MGGGNLFINAEIEGLKKEVAELNRKAQSIDLGLANSYWLSGGTSIPENADLNDYKTPGNYYCWSNNTVKTLINCPVKGAFVMKIEHGNGASYPCQSIRELISGIIHYRIYDADWSEWNRDLNQHDIEPFSLVKTFDFGVHDSTTENVDTVMYYILNQAMPLDGTGKLTYICTFTVGSIYRAIIQPYSSREYASAIVFSYRLPQIIYYQKWAGVLTKYTAKWEGQVI